MPILRTEIHVFVVVAIILFLNRWEEFSFLIHEKVPPPALKQPSTLVHHPEILNFGLMVMTKWNSSVVTPEKGMSIFYV